jgi:hypothetical protein
MASKKLKFVNLKSLSVVIAFLTIGWPQTAKAQYNLQLDSVITEVVSGQFGLNDSSKFIFEVPAGKVWKLESAFSSGGNGTSSYGLIRIKFQDSGGKTMTITNSGGYSNIKVNGVLGGTGVDNTGVIWLNAGSKIIFSIYGADYYTRVGGYWRGFLSALQFSIE